MHMANKKSTQSAYTLLTEALLSDKGIGHLTEAAFSVFKRPIFVIGASYSFLAKAFDASVYPEESPIYRLLSSEEFCNQTFLDKKGIAGLKRDKVQIGRAHV